MSAVCDITAFEQKAWTTLVAKAAMRGWQLWRTDPDDGAQRFFAGRWGVIQALANVAEVERFLETAGGA
jgi:hypothetical protein